MRSLGQNPVVPDGSGSKRIKTLPGGVTVMSVSKDSASQRLSSFTFTAYVFVVLAPSSCKLFTVSVLEVTWVPSGMGGIGGSPGAAAPVLLHIYVSSPIVVPGTRSMLRVTEPPAQTVSVEGETA